MLATVPVRRVLRHRLFVPTVAVYHHAGGVIMTTTVVTTVTSKTAAIHRVAKDSSPAATSAVLTSQLYVYMLKLCWFNILWILVVDLLYHLLSVFLHHIYSILAASRCCGFIVQEKILLSMIL